MFDTHCHLNLDVFDDKIDSVVKEAKREGVTRILIPGTDIHTSKKTIRLADKYPSLYASVGLHPTEKLDEENLPQLLKEIEKLAESDSVLAIGEVGLDHYRYESATRVQEKYFKKQAELAAKLGLSLIIHNRQSTDSLIESLESVWSQALSYSTVFHCAEPREELLNFAKENGVFMGVDGDITYDEEKQKFVKNIPLELLVVETDSPFLTPLPVRSEGVAHNEPKYLNLVIKKLSELLEEDEKSLAEITTKNALKLFNLA